MAAIQAILALFNEKAAKLDRLSFTKHVREHSLSFSASSKDGIVTFSASGPSEEATDAFVLTLRFFVQDNEAISIRNIAQLYTSPPLSSDLVSQMREGRARLNAFLDEWSHVEFCSQRLSHRRILEVFLYGGLAHANPEKKAEWDTWAGEPMFSAIMQTCFHSVLLVLLRFILWLHEHNLLALKELAASAPPPSAGV